jgi:PAS domain S-box-containing protein
MAGYGPRRTSADRPDPARDVRAGGSLFPDPSLDASEGAQWSRSAGAELTVDAARAASDLMIGALHFSTDVSILVFDADLRFLAASGSALDRSGYGPARLVGHRAPEVLPAAAWAALRSGYEAALSGASLTIVFVSANGRTTWETTFSPVRDGPRVTGGMVVCRDVTARRRDAVLLDEITDVFDLTFAHSPVCQALLAPDGRWARVNAALCALLARDEDDLLATTASAVTHPEDRAHEAWLLGRLSTGGAPHYDVRKRFVRGDGTAVTADVRVAQVRARDGAVRGYVTQVTPAVRGAARR